MLSPIKKKKDLHVSHMKIKGIKTKSDHCKFHLENNLLLYLLLLIYLFLDSWAYFLALV